MTTTPSPLRDDALLVAWLDGEVDADERRLVEATIASDATVRAKVAHLRAARTALAAALAADPAAAPPRRWYAWAVAAASLFVVAAVLVNTSAPGPAQGVENEFLALRALPLRGGFPVFGDIRFDLEGRAKTSRPCRILARAADETDEQVAARAIADPANAAVIPLVLDAEVVLPDGTTRRGPVVRVEGEFGATASRLRVALIDAVVEHPAISPFLAARLAEEPAPLGVDPRSHDEMRGFLWAFERGAVPAVGGRHGFVPEQAGDYRIRFVVRSFTAADDPRFVRMAKPLIATTAFSIGGSFGAWSEAADGLRARIAAKASQVHAGEPLVVGLQLSNASDRPRSYNVAGVTRAPIPQPFHFDLVVDGEPWQQRDDLPVIFSGGSEFLAQPPGTMRSVIVLADYWHRDGTRLSQLTGKHTIALRFHFVPTLWAGDPRQLWQGTVETPPIEVRIEAAPR